MSTVPSSLVRNRLRSVMTGLASLLVILLLIPWKPGWTGELPSKPGPNEKRVIVILIDGFSLESLVKYGGTNIYRLLASGAIGLMGFPSRHRDLASVAVSLGAGRPLRGEGSEGSAFNQEEIWDDEEAGRQYWRRTRWPLGPTGIVLPEWPKLLSANPRQNPGLLGETLHAFGLATAVLGNSDLPEKRIRSGALIAADHRGRVDGGDVSWRVLMPSREGLLPWETNTSYILRRVHDLIGRTHLIVVDFGDGRRLEEMRDQALPEVAEAETARLTHKLDHFLGGLMDCVEPDRTLLCLIGLTPGRQELASHNLLVPVIVAGGDTPAGLLTSPSTRRPGLLSALDVAPSLLRFLGLPQPPSMIGRAWQVAAGPADPKYLLRLTEELSLVRRARPPLVRGYVFLMTVAMVMSLVAFFGPERLGEGVRRRLPGVLVFIGAVPISFLLAAAFTPGSLLAYTFLVSLLGLLLTLASLRFASGPLESWLILGASLVTLVGFDTAFGTPLQQKALLSYDLMSGARYYGIGNEYMGALIGAAILAGGIGMEMLDPRWGKLAAVPLWGAVLVLLAFPGWGANAGGTIAAAFTFGLAILLLFRPRLNWKEALSLGLAVAGLLAGVTWWDSSRSWAVQSHFGRALNLVQYEGMAAAWQIISQKTATNLRLIRYTIWTRVFIMGLVILAVFLSHPRGSINHIYRAYPRLSRCLSAMVAGSFVALVFNDSGVVAAATMMIYGMGPLLTLILSNKTQLTKTPPEGKICVD